MNERLEELAEQEPFARLLRIMGTFDLATGHADSWDDLFESLESELSDVLGHYREALKAQPKQEPVAWVSDSPTKGNGKQLHFTKADAWKWSSNITPLYTVPPKREWVGLTNEEISEAYNANYDNYYNDVDIVDCITIVRAVEAKLKEKNERPPASI